VWDKSVRQILFTVIYEYLFWGQNFDDSQIDWDLIYTLNKFEYEEAIDEAQDLFKKFLETEQELEDGVKPYMQNWDKTFDIVRAVLFTAQMELASNYLTIEEKEKIVGKYIHLTQDMIGGKNPALVHAVLSKIVHKDIEKAD
jgi:transcription termination factor NusB